MYWNNKDEIFKSNYRYSIIKIRVSIILDKNVQGQI